MEVVVEVGDWEHTCCGPAYERHQLVDLGCLRTTTPQGHPSLTETRHHLEPEVTVSGRIVDIQVQRPGGETESIQRLPSGRALRGFDPVDYGHLEQAWTEIPLPPGESFLLTVQVAHRRCGPGHRADQADVASSKLKTLMATAGPARGPSAQRTRSA